MLTSSNIPFDIKDSVPRNTMILEGYMDEALREHGDTLSEPSSQPTIELASEPTTQPDSDDESILSKTYNDVRR